MRRSWVFLVVGSVLTGGCVPSLHPLYTQNDVIFETALLGKWGDPDSFWRFEKAAVNNPTGRGYLLTMCDSGKPPVKLLAHLLRLGDTLYLDLTPAAPDPPRIRTLDEIHHIPAHTFWKVHRISPDFRWSIMVPATVAQMLSDAPDALKHEKVDDGIVLTASTKELQEFIKKHSAEKGFFTEPTVMKRVEEKSETVSSAAKK